MTIEKQLIHKKYYESLIGENHSSQPVQILGELYFEEQKKEVYDLSFIRFAQGEIYFHSKDFESAIFKWENIKNELEPWAKKNMADSYLELGLTTNAENIYTSIISDSIVLDTEIGLQLFSLYIRSGKLEKADHVIKRVVSINPDYPNVTETARKFFEENGDWKSAVELAINEGKRTQSIQWYTLLRSYVDQGLTKTLPPEYFEETLKSLKVIDQSHFEQLLSSLWKSYESDPKYLQWLKTVNHLFESLEFHPEEQWGSASYLFHGAFIKLVSGHYFIKEIDPLIPALLNNWLKISDPVDKTFVYGAVLSWNDYFPNTLSRDIVEKAESVISRETNTVKILDDSLKLLSDISKWGEEQYIQVKEYLQWNGQPVLVDEDPQDYSLQLHDFLKKFDAAERNEMLLRMIRIVLNSILENRSHQKEVLTSAIEKNEEMLAKLNGAVHQLGDQQDEKNKLIKKSFQERKDKMKEEIRESIPDILKGCADIIQEDSDVKTIHVDLNKEMNKRVQHYLNETTLPKFKSTFKEWIENTFATFNESKRFIDEMTEGFNLLFGEERLKMECDFQVLNDWRRDMDRMTNFVQIEQDNAFFRTTPTQFLIKSAGKLFGSLSQNKGILQNQYKKLIENEDFIEAADEISNKFLHQFDLFQWSIERDIAMFFQNPLETLKRTIEEIEEEKAGHNQELHILKSNPETFNDPFTLFEVRHRQQEWINIGNVRSY